MLAREMTELVRDTKPPLRFRHSTGSISGARRRASVAGFVPT